jgi:hypothetical protein
MWVRLQQFDDGVDHLQRSEHAQLHCRNGGVVEHGIGLGQDPLAIQHAKVADVNGVLHGQGGHCRSGMATLGEQGFDICLQTGTTTGIVAGKAEDNGARIIDSHGARAYH